MLKRSKHFFETFQHNITKLQVDGKQRNHQRDFSTRKETLFELSVKSWSGVTVRNIYVDYMLHGPSRSWGLQGDRPRCTMAKNQRCIWNVWNSSSTNPMFGFSWGRRCWLCLTRWWSEVPRRCSNLQETIFFQKKEIQSVQPSFLLQVKSWIVQNLERIFITIQDLCSQDFSNELYETPELWEPLSSELINSSPIQPFITKNSIRTYSQTLWCAHHGKICFTTLHVNDQKQTGAIADDLNQTKIPYQGINLRFIFQIPKSVERICDTSRTPHQYKWTIQQPLASHLLCFHSPWR